MNKEQEQKVFEFKRRIAKEEAENPNIFWAEGLIFKDEIGDDWLERFFNRIQGSTSLSIEFYAFLYSKIFSTVRNNTVQSEARKLSTATGAYHEINFTVNYPELCADLALLAYESK